MCIDHIPLIYVTMEKKPDERKKNVTNNLERKKNRFKLFPSIDFEIWTEHATIRTFPTKPI